MILLVSINICFYTYLLLSYVFCFFLLNEYDDDAFAFLTRMCSDA